ncbi:ImmA/IrrE family metallo-endopeptidase [Micromonospora echinofusca]|uniref:ImmA/IrrE family metallo-endopeptidase n=1 Tax=Micromonospora echinofusca TaxID=47858 RepID=UPI002020C97C|nr:ImmA/IrrE family metallo-endopeptidase [Micromonospora sp. MSM11]MCL7457675.1 ImmA/IrrE family metallo-endopeptidase [Micromonospora sp. MSM11]
MLRQLDVDLPTPLTVRGLVSALETTRGRRIQLAAMSVDGRAGPCGLWVATSGTDYVLFSRDAPPVLRVQTILHELMHIALRHTARAVASGAAGETAAAHGVLARSPATFDEQQEHDAELLATYLGARLDGGGEAVAFDELGGVTAAVMHRIAATLTD